MKKIYIYNKHYIYISIHNIDIKNIFYIFYIFYVYSLPNMAIRCLEKIFLFALFCKKIDNNLKCYKPQK